MKAIKLRNQIVVLENVSSVDTITEEWSDQPFKHTVRVFTDKTCHRIYCKDEDEMTSTLDLIFKIITE